MTGYPSIYDTGSGGGSGGGDGTPTVPADSQVYGFSNNGSSTTAAQVLPITFPDPGYAFDPFGSNYGLAEPLNGFTDGFVQTVNLTGAAPGTFYGGRFNFEVPNNTYFEIGCNGGPDVVNMLLLITSSTDFNDPNLSALQLQFADNGASTTGTADGNWIMVSQAFNTNVLPSGVNIPFGTSDMRIGFERSGTEVWVHINGTKTHVHDNISEFAHVTMGVISSPLVSPATTSGVFGVYSGDDTTEEGAFEVGVTKLDLANAQTNASPVVTVNTNSVDEIAVQQDGQQYSIEYVGPVYRGAELFVTAGVTSASIIPSGWTPLNITATYVSDGVIEFEFDAVNDSEFTVTLLPTQVGVGSTAVVNFVRTAALYNTNTNRARFTVYRLQYSGGANNVQAGDYIMNIVARVK